MAQANADIGCMSFFWRSVFLAAPRAGKTALLELGIEKIGAGDEIRTHDFHLGKVTLYP